MKGLKCPFAHLCGSSPFCGGYAGARALFSTARIRFSETE